MKKRLHRMGRMLTALALGAALFAAGGTTALAASLPEDVGVTVKDERSILEGADFDSDISYQRTRSLHLAYGYSEISKVDYNRVQLLGTTQCHHECPEVYLGIYLDKMDPKTGLIETAVRRFDDEEQNVDHLTRSMNLLVKDGYYYSVRGFHSAHHDGVVETTTTTTNWVYIGKTDEPVD